MNKYSINKNNKVIIPPFIRPLSYSDYLNECHILCTIPQPYWMYLENVISNIELYYQIYSNVNKSTKKRFFKKNNNTNTRDIETHKIIDECKQLLISNYELK